MALCPILVIRLLASSNVNVTGDGRLRREASKGMETRTGQTGQMAALDHNSPSTPHKTETVFQWWSVES